MTSQIRSIPKELVGILNGVIREHISYNVVYSLAEAHTKYVCAI